MWCKINQINFSHLTRLRLSCAFPAPPVVPPELRWLTLGMPCLRVTISTPRRAAWQHLMIPDGKLRLCKSERPVPISDTDINMDVTLICVLALFIQ